jgi:protein tyrosine/serine phosphatase
VRSLAWDGCLNVRDLGGHRTAGGGETRFGAVVRADAVAGLSDAGWEALVAHGIRTVVDLRLHDERAADPPRQIPVDVVHVPLIDGGLPEYDPVIAAAIDAAADPRAAVRAFYLELLEHFHANFARVVRAVATAPPGGVVVHCKAGKDRTGLVVALLLRLAGVGLEEIGADYAVSGSTLAEALEASWRARRTTPSAHCASS